MDNVQNSSSKIEFEIVKITGKPSFLVVLNPEHTFF